MVTIDTLIKTESIANTFCSYLGAGISVVSFKLARGASVRLEGLERLPKAPVIVAMNHTHMMDFLPLRTPLLFKGKTFVSWVKARNYHNPAMRQFLSYTGNVPICSRGYIIAGDLQQLAGKLEDESVYRALRDHVDKGVALPEGPLFDRIQNERRSILGWDFDPSTSTYREAIQATYYEMMQHALRLTQRGVDRGDHAHIYPQGTRSKQLTPGRNGIIQAAIALNLPILPVGVSRTLEVFKAPNSPWPKPHSGEIIVRFGEVMAIPRDELPYDYRPFHPLDERQHRATLDGHIQDVMQRLNGLLEPEYQWADDLQGSVKQGISRFL